MAEATPNDQRTYAIIGAAMEVHRRLGCGFLEAVYHEAFALEMLARDLPFQHEVELPVTYRGHVLKTTYRADFIVFGEVIVELKATASLSGVEKAQVINYLKATGMPIGLLINFGASSLQHERVILQVRKSS